MDNVSCLTMKNNDSKWEEKRSSKRQEVNLPAIVKIHNKDKECYCFLAKIIDISCGGIKLLVEKKDANLKKLFETCTQFLLFFEDKANSNIVSAICRPVYLMYEEVMKIGSSFVNIETVGL